MAITSAYDGSEIKFDKSTEWQEIFSHVYCAMAKQGEFAYGGATCFYLAPDGRRCAIGHCFTAEEAATIGPEPLSVAGLINRQHTNSVAFLRWLMRLPEDGWKHVHEAQELQRCHDVPAQSRQAYSECLARMRIWADERGINVPAVAA
jgi:hypothetical protein